jgi:hypothetical protein
MLRRLSGLRVGRDFDCTAFGLSLDGRRMHLNSAWSARALAGADRTGHDLMKRLISVSLTVFSCLCLLLATERRAMAYVDPGSGLLALQSVGSLLAAAGFFLRRRIMGVFGKKKPMTSVISPVTVRKEDSRNTA